MSTFMTQGMQNKARRLGFTLPSEGVPRLFAHQVGIRDLVGLFSVGTQPVVNVEP
jgi:hypothetical protein